MIASIIGNDSLDYRGGRFAPAFHHWLDPRPRGVPVFLSAVAAGRKPEPGLHDGLRTQLVLDAAYASAESDSWVAVPGD